VDKQFEPLASGEVLSVDRSVQILLRQTTFRASEFAAALKAAILAKTQGSPAQADWFSDRGVPCEALRFGARGWQRGRVRISLEFHPDSDELQPDARTSEAPEPPAIAPLPAPAPAGDDSDDSDDWLEPVDVPASEPSAVLPKPAEDEGELEPATEASASDIEPHEIEDVFEDAPPPPFELVDDSDEELEAPLTADSDVDDIFAHAPDPDLDDLSDSRADAVEDVAEFVEGDTLFEEAPANEPADTAASSDTNLGEDAADESEGEDDLFADDTTEELLTDAEAGEGEDLFGAAEESAVEGEDIFAADAMGDGAPFGMVEDEGSDDLFGAIAPEAGGSNEANLLEDDEDDLFGSGEADDLSLDLEEDRGAIALGSTDDELVAGDEDDLFGNSDEFSLDLGDDLDDDVQTSNGKEEKDVFEDIWQDIDDLPSN